MTNEGFKFQASVKDTDGDMVNVRADSQAEFESALLEFPSGAYAQFKANVRGGSALGAIAAPAQPEQQWQQSPPQQQQPQWSQPQQQAAPAVPQVRQHPEGKPCACGQTLIFKQITSKKNGNQYSMWTCPSQQRKGDGHDSEFVD